MVGLLAGLLMPRGKCVHSGSLPNDGGAHSVSCAHVRGGVCSSPTGDGTIEIACEGDDCVCIANREDNMMHIGLVTVTACAAFSSKTGYSKDELNCDRYDKAPVGSAAPPKSCDNGLGRADWVFSTTYQLTGDCDQHHGAKRNAAMLVPFAEAMKHPGKPHEVCARGWHGQTPYDLTQ